MKKYLPYLIAFGAGYVLANRLKSIPGINRIPQL